MLWNKLHSRDYICTLFLHCCWGRGVYAIRFCSIWLQYCVFFFMIMTYVACLGWAKNPIATLVGAENYCMLLWPRLYHNNKRTPCTYKYSIISPTISVHVFVLKYNSIRNHSHFVFKQCQYICVRG